MSKSLEEYADWLDERKLLWPTPPEPSPAKATPYLKPLPDVRGVVWSLYGTLLTIADGKLLLLHPQQIRMQVALDKTIQEFNMWNSMSRKPGAPWEYMLQQYTNLLEERSLAASPRKGDQTEIDASEIWRKLIERLGKKEYQYDESLYGDESELAEKVAYFFQACLQGVGPAPNALRALQTVNDAGFTQGLVADAQPFSLLQLKRALRKQGPVASLFDLLTPSCLALSYQLGVRQPSQLLFETCVSQFRRSGMEPPEILFVSSRVADELAVAKKLGLRTALYTGDKTSLQATSADLKQPELKPDRILTDLAQVRQILGIGGATA